ncbi:TPA_asm: M [Morus betacytorhabdovirus 1]|nr:TPA_asm: M [Morus betacytorhabdovirus 1]
MATTGDHQTPGSVVRSQIGRQVAQPNRVILKENIMNGASLNRRKFFIGKSTWRIIPTDNVKVQYCGIFSDFQCEIKGRDKCSLIRDWKDIFENIIRIQLAEKEDNEDDKCVSSLLRELADKVMSNMREDQILSFDPLNLLLGGPTWTMKVVIPSNKIVKVQCQPSREAIFGFDFNESVAVNNKLAYIATGKGRINICHFNRAYAMSIYRQAPSMMLAETLMNSSEEGSSSNQPEKGQTELVEGDDMKNLSSDQKIVSDCLYSK